MGDRTTDMVEIAASRRAGTELPVFGEPDCWNLAGLHQGRTLPCTSPRTLLHYLASGGTHRAEATQRNVGQYVDVEVTGPVADDEKRMSVRYRLTRGDFHDGLSGAEQGVLTRLLAEYAPEKCPPYRDAAQMIRDCLIKGFTRL